MHLCPQDVPFGSDWLPARAIWESIGAVVCIAACQVFVVALVISLAHVEKHTSVVVDSTCLPSSLWLLVLVLLMLLLTLFIYTLFSMLRFV